MTDTPRFAVIDRATRETRISGRLELDGAGEIRVDTGIGFFDHMLTALAFHAGWNLELECHGDLEVDDHHTAEDCALAIGEALDRALGDRTGVSRFGAAHAPLDEALARTVVDLSGRPWPEVHLGLSRNALGGLAADVVQVQLNTQLNVHSKKMILILRQNLKALVMVCFSLPILEINLT